MENSKIVKKTPTGGVMSAEYFTGFGESGANFSSNSEDAKLMGQDAESNDDKLWFNMSKLNTDHRLSEGFYMIERA
jgi:hypothetical protein